MADFQHLFGPVPSRRLGRSLGVSPIPGKTCNYACIYCQLGRTDHMTNTRQPFYPVEKITGELDRWLAADKEPGGGFDVVTVVGEGEPTLYADLGTLLRELRRRTDKPVAVITNGALLYDPEVVRDLMEADIVLPSLDAWDEATFRKIDRPYGRLNWEETVRSLADFSHRYHGQLWLELMLVDGVNTKGASEGFRPLLEKIRYDRLYLNTPVRPPAEKDVQPVPPERLHRLAEELGGISIDSLTSGAFASEAADDYEAVTGIIRRHPMNQHEIAGFLASRGENDPAPLLRRLEQDPAVEAVDYKGFITYRLRPETNAQ